MEHQRWADIIRCLEEDEWPIHTINDEKTWLRTGFKGKNGRWVCFGHYLPTPDIFLFYSTCPANVPEDRRYAAAEFITRANYGMYIGNFEMDFDDGEIRYKSSLDLEGVQESLAVLLKNILYPNVNTLDRYLPGIMSVAFSNTSPTDALASVEDQE